MSGLQKTGRMQKRVYAICYRRGLRASHSCVGGFVIWVTKEPGFARHEENLAGVGREGDHERYVEKP